MNRHVSLTPDEFLQALEETVGHNGTAKALAKRWGISEQYLCDVRQGRREPSATLATLMGYRRVIRFERG